MEEDVSAQLRAVQERLEAFREIINQPIGSQSKYSKSKKPQYSARKENIKNNEYYEKSIT